MNLDARALARLVRFVVALAMLWSIAVVAGVLLLGDASRPAFSIGPGLAAGAIAVFFVNHGVRFLRWHLMLRAEGHRLPWRRSLAIFMAGLALLPTPAKAGVAARSLLLIPEGVPVHVSLAAWFAERLLDLVGLLILASVLIDVPGGSLPFAIAVAFAGMLVVVAAPAVLRSLLPRLARAPRVQRALTWVHRCLVDAAEMLAGWRLPAFIALGALANVAAGLLVWLALPGAIDPGKAIGILAVSQLSGSITMLPGGIGGFDVALLAQLSAAGVPDAQAWSALSVVRIATLWGSVAVGLPLLGLALRRLGTWNQREGAAV
jgi:uncharacterized membrane protein YbhN (UPF0104 family)